MLGETKPGMQCAEFDVLLTEALDGTLQGERRERFEAHKSECVTCGALFEEASSGLAWLREVEEVTPPPNLVHNILAATLGATEQAAQAEPKHSAWERLLRHSRMVFAPVLTPRFGMSMGMAFFSITLVLNMAQIRIKDLTPHKYYENMRLVYEIESRVRELRNQSEENEREREEKSRQREKNGNQTQEQNQKSEPEQREHHQYSLGLDAQMLASLNGMER